MVWCGAHAAEKHPEREGKMLHQCLCQISGSKLPLFWELESVFNFPSFTQCRIRYFGHQICTSSSLLVAEYYGPQMFGKFCSAVIIIYGARIIVYDSQPDP